MTDPMRYLDNRQNFKLDPTSLRLTPGDWLLCYAIFWIIVCSLISFFTYVEPSLKGASNLYIGADSEVYLYRAGMRQDTPDRITLMDIDSPLMSLTGGTFGPVLIARTLQSNFLILCFNYVVFTGTILLFAQTIPVRVPLLVLLLLSNPQILISMITLNKEVIVLLSIALLFGYLADPNRSKVMLILCLSVSLIGRWEHLLITVVFLVLVGGNKSLRRWRKTKALFLIVLISLIYPMIANPLDLLLNMSTKGALNGALTNLQEHYMYFVVVIPKIAMNLYADGVSFLLHGPSTENPNYINTTYIAPLSSIANMIVTLWFAAACKFNLKDDRMFFAAFYAIVLSAAPFVQSRYFFPVYVVICLELARDRKRVISPVVETCWG
jgi:hypothetical protein